MDSHPSNDQPGFFTRLKQHHVYRVAAWYGASIAVLIQIVARALPYFGWASAVPAVIVILIAGFPVAIALAWVLVRPADTAAYTAWQRRHWKLGAIVLPVVIAAVVTSGIFAFRISARHTARLAIEQTAPAFNPPAKSIAVLPFVNMSGDPKNGYFSDGITEEILNALAQIPDLKVTARTSAFAFGGKNERPRTIGEALGVANLLEGSVQKAGDEVRINVQLVDARTGYQLWSEKYDRKLTNIFAIEDDISNAVAGKLRVQLTGGAGQALVTLQTVDTRAHDFYLRGLGLLAARGPGLLDAVAAFQNAVKIDPQYADAWGALAETELALPGYVVSVSRADATVRAEAAAQTALNINPHAVPALVARAGVYAYHLQWRQAQDTYERAISLAPGDAEAADQYAQFLFATDQLDPALEQINHAQQMDPLSAIIGVVRSGILMALHRDIDATAQLELVLSRHPDFYPANLTAVALYLDLGRFADAQRQMHAMATNFRVDANAKVILVRGIANPAQRDVALASLKTAAANADIRGDQVWYSAFLAMLGDRDDAIAQLQVCASECSAAAFGMVWTKPFDPLRQDLRFRALLKKLGLPYTPTRGAVP